MRARASSEHQAAVERRLALLRAELAGETRLAAVRAPDRAGRTHDGFDAVDASDGHGTAALDPADALDGATTQATAHAQVLPGPEEWWGQHTRLAGSRALEHDPGPEPIEVPGGGERPTSDTSTALPVPGRHAARRPGRGGLADAVRRAPGELLPEALRGRVALGPGGLATVALLVATALALSCWFLVRARPTAVDLTSGAPGAAAGSGSPGSSGSSGSSGTAIPDAPVGSPLPSAVDTTGGPAPAVTGPSPSGATGTVTVDVEGRVRRPGIAVLPSGARVVDALEAAGGARPGVDLTPINLARVLVDGEQLLVGVRGATAVAPPPTGASGTAGPTTLTNLNTATEAQLEELPEVGPVTARAILDYRDQHGGFAAVDELLDVDGIGEATLEQLRPWVTV